jgi:hypothetical protein
MAGSFGYQKDKYDLSMAIGKEVLLPALKEITDEPWICAPGFSCRHQINDGVQRTSHHPAVIMASVI